MSEISVEILEKFCSKERSGISSPFSQGAYSYATDGMIIIRVPKLEAIPERETPFIDKLSFHIDPSCQSIDVKVDLEDYKKIQCHKCEDLAPDEVHCEECEGEGIVITETDYNQYENECLSCDGSGLDNNHFGRKTCYVCKGKRFFYSPKSAVKIGDAHIHIDFFLLTQNLKNVRFVPFGTINPVKFVFDGGCGLIMPLRV